MKKRTIHLLFAVVLVLVTTEKTTAINDSVHEKRAQGFLIGLNFGGMITDLASAPFNRCYKDYRWSSVTFGASYTTCLNNFSDIKLGVQYERKGSAVAEPTGFYPFPPSASDFVQLRYLTFHQSILFTTRGRTFVYIGPGIYQAFLFHAPNLWCDARDNVSYKNVRKLDFGPRLQAGIGMQVSPGLRIHFEITGSTGTMSVYNIQDEFFHRINRSLSATAALTYNF